jgi:hypothetical protein
MERVLTPAAGNGLATIVVTVDCNGAGVETGCRYNVMGVLYQLTPAGWVPHDGNWFNSPVVACGGTYNANAFYPNANLLPTGTYGWSATIYSGSYNGGYGSPLGGGSITLGIP